MGENNTYKIVSVIALVIGVIGVSLAYAAFSSTLTINSSAEVTPDSSNFNVDFSTSNSGVVATAITPTLSPATDGPTATNGTIDNTSDPTITGLKATFTEPGQSVTYDFYTYNAGLYPAFLNSIVFNGTKSCAATGTGDAQATASQVAAACNGITLSVQVGSETATTTSVASISGHTLGINAGEAVQVVISYEAGSAIADGDFEVTLPSIVLTYNSAD